MKSLKNIGLFMLSLSLLLACQAQTVETNQTAIKYSDQHDFCPKVSNKIITECTAKGGTLQKQGKAQCYTCTIEYSDAGKMCAGSADCQGDCYNYQEPVAVNVPNQTGTCAKNNIIFGCHQKIDNGIAANAMICVD